MAKMSKIWMGILAVGVLSGTSGCTYGSRDTAWEDMTALTLGPRCGSRVGVYYHDGDFNSDQITDISAAVWNINYYMSGPYIWMGAAPWRWENAPWGTVTVEARTPPGGSAYGNITMASDHYFGKGTVQLGSTVTPLPTGRTGYYTGNTFRGRVEHELNHAMAGIGDLYDNDDGHPTLLMGKGYEVHSQSAKGDLIGLIEKGCASREVKDYWEQQIMEDR